MKNAATQLDVDDSPSRLDLFLSRKTGQSRVFVQSQIKRGNVRVNGDAVTKPSIAVKIGDKVSIEFEDREAAFANLTPVSGNLEILFEDADVLVLNKAQGVVIHPALGHHGDTLVHHLLFHFKEKPDFAELSPERPGIVHRLDKGTSGVLIVAKNRRAQERLSLQFKNREMKKEYECVVWGKPAPEGTVETPIGRHNWDRKKMSSKSRAAREAKTQWKTVRNFSGVTHLAVFPHTGRTHQIRVHLAENGFPIVGDDLYATRSVQGKKQRVSPETAEFLKQVTLTFLHARSLTFTHPTTAERIQITARRPQIFDEFLSLLEKEGT